MDVNVCEGMCKSGSVCIYECIYECLSIYVTCVCVTVCEWGCGGVPFRTSRWQNHILVLGLNVLSDLPYHPVSHEMTLCPKSMERVKKGFKMA